MMESLVGQKVVIDLRSKYVCLGTLIGIHADYLELKNADLHDLRDTDTSRENYVAASKSTGIKRNRRKLILFRREIVAMSPLDDVVDD
ncbi:MAG: hypothetical protein FJ261_09030 [Planctomycetes bacterium]|nr:hypothetical protein [Planctomycetota bacterium]